MTGSAKVDVVPLPQPGGCLCGAVRYRLNAAPLLAYACHCHDCQTRSGAAFTLTLVIRTADLTVSGAVEAIRRRARSGREVEHSACPACRVALFSRALAAPDYTSLRAGALDDAGWVEPIAQSFVESAIPWAVIPGVRIVPWAAFDFVALGRDWAAGAPRFVAAEA
jgi:hypothetical protein